MVSIDDFFKIELKIGTILEAEEVEGSEKLLKLQVDLGENQPRQILSGIRQWYKPQDLVGKQYLFASNLEPRVLMGYESHGMILCAGDQKPIPLKPVKKIANGSKLR